MPKIVVEIEWDYPNGQHWLNADNIKTALGTYCKNTAFNVVELVAEDEGPFSELDNHGILEEPDWIEMRYKWASIINRLAVIAMAEEVSTNDRDDAQDAIDMVIPYLGLAEE